MSYEAHRAVLVLGGIRSGKSEYAESLVGSAPEVRYVATAAPHDDDPGWAGRVEAHRVRRPAHWVTEDVGTTPERLAELIAETKPDQVLLVDDLGGWVAAQSAGVTLAPVVDAVRGCAGRVIFVSPEVGLSVVPPTAAGVAFADTLGSVNRTLAEVCDLVVLVVAGQPVPVKRGVPVLPGVPARTAEVVEVPTFPGDGADEPVIEPGMSLPLPDQQASVTATEALASLDVPGSGLGRLAEVISFTAGVQASGSPRPYQSVRVLVLHGVHEGGVAEGDGDWARRLGQLAEGGGPLGLLAAQAGASVQVADLASAGLPAARPIESGDAADPAGVEAGLRYGWRLAEAAADSGVDLLVLAAGGPGQEGAAVAVISALSGVEAPSVLPRVYLPGGRYDDLAWMVRTAAVRDALYRVKGRTTVAKDLLAALGGADLAAVVGVLLGASARRTPVMVDGPVGVAAGLLARELATQSRLWILLADDGRHPATRAGADRLSLTPLADLGLGLGEGAAALTVLPLVQSALAVAAGTAPARVSTVDSHEDVSLADPDTVRA